MFPSTFFFSNDNEIPKTYIVVCDSGDVLCFAKRGNFPIYAYFFGALHCCCCSTQTKDKYPKYYKDDLIFYHTHWIVTAVKQ